MGVEATEVGGALTHSVKNVDENDLSTLLFIGFESLNASTMVVMVGGHGF